jgi:hypothetical protein
MEIMAHGNITMLGTHTNNIVIVIVIFLEMINLAYLNTIYGEGNERSNLVYLFTM